MPSIYNIEKWVGNRTYKKNEIILSDSTFLYCVVPHTSTTSSPMSTGNPPVLLSTNWGGAVILDSKSKPFFLWAPSSNLSVSQDPIVKTIKFGDGYEQRIRDGINNNRLKLDLSFEKRDSQETAAIIHFLSARGGSESFAFTLPEPYSIVRLMVCRNWTNNYNFLNNYSIKATFEEVVN